MKAYFWGVVSQLFPPPLTYSVMIIIILNNNNLHEYRVRFFLERFVF